MKNRQWQADELRGVRDAAVREICHRSLAAFARRAWPILEPATPLKWGWALDAICDHLEAVSRGEINRLLMNVPPGSMKSLLTGVIWPAWEWTRRPDLRYLGTAHKHDLAVRDNMKCRRLVQSAWYQNLWPIQWASDQNAKTKFENSATGFREAMAFTSMTGSRGDRILLDDPHSVDDANSPAKLDADILTFREALPSRVNNDQSAIVIIMQRLHERDVSAVAMDLGYDHLVIPMRYEKGRAKTSSIGWRDPRTAEGALMFPERFPETQVAELEKTLGSYAAAGQLQQRPAPRDGGLFKPIWFKTVGAVPAGPRIKVRAWDLAATAKTATNRPDWTVGLLMSRGAQGDFLIENVKRLQGSPMDISQTIITQAIVDGRETRIRIPQDPGQAGKAQAAAFIRDLAGFAIRADPVTGDKSTRATPAAVQAEAGNIAILVTGDPIKDAWIETFLSEISLFPASAHDDQVDALADALNALSATRASVFDML